ncbi:hypothetical protein EVAR_650_1 [Eumeta japonica]|uniref:Uncharacterized protein n=1 Tax=Eumeta variegata TaxID=151549 RepID=A0A4C1SBM7_EUMVA|nr:hypothetical protein EVAR_650_1 [Eumeta japonica]
MLTIAPTIAATTSGTGRLTYAAKHEASGSKNMSENFIEQFTRGHGSNSKCGIPSDSKTTRVDHSLPPFFVIKKTCVFSNVNNTIAHAKKKSNKENACVHENEAQLNKSFMPRAPTLFRPASFREPRIQFIFYCSRGSACCGRDDTGEVYAHRKDREIVYILL